ncbi:hypothetical protein GU926_17035 [Nibribacter ruber]|uniref:Uncharacterized protein n=1 Tax=Nibribacter ruber TaxID=2698458 RepID=A0A6P1P3Y3_9BACT|nr:hypothetical protein [Nibribacter ruber]QHL89038.1 hypothetical protein GU926_17035 [Nibribacter ruber]
MIKTVFVTVLILVLPLLFLYWKNLLQYNRVEKGVSSLAFILSSVGLFLLVFFLQVNFSLEVLQNPVPYIAHLHPFQGEVYIYSTILSLLHYESVETVSLESVLHGFTGVSMYHFLEFWLGSLFKLVFNAKSDIVLFFFVYPVFKAFTLLTFGAVLAGVVKDRVGYVLVGILLFCFAVFGFLWITAPIGKIHLRDMIMLPILVLVFKALYDREYEVALFLLCTATVEYILFLPALLLTTAMFWTRLERKSMWVLLGFLVGYVLFYILFQERVENKYFHTDYMSVLYSFISLEKLKELYRVLLMAFLTYPIRIVLAFYILHSFETLRARKVAFDAAVWMVLFFVGYHIASALMGDLSLDAWQLKQVAVNLSLVAFLFVLYHLLAKRQYAFCIILILFLSDYKFPFEKISFEEEYSIELESKLASISGSKPVKGFFIDENLGLPEKWALFYYPTHAVKYARANDYRFYLFNYDIAYLKESIDNYPPAEKNILNNIIYPLFPTEVEVLQNARQNDVSVIWVSKKSKYLKAFVEKKPLYDLGDYLVYHIK